MRLVFAIAFAALLLMALPLAWATGQWLAMGVALLIVWGLSCAVLGGMMLALESTIRATHQALRR